MVGLWIALEMGLELILPVSLARLVAGIMAVALGLQLYPAHPREGSSDEARIPGGFSPRLAAQDGSFDVDSDDIPIHVTEPWDVQKQLLLRMTEELEDLRRKLEESSIKTHHLVRERDELRHRIESARPPPLVPTLDEGIKLGFHKAVEEYRRRLLSAALERTSGNRSETARLLGLQRTYLYRLLKQLQEPPPAGGAGPA